VKGPALLAYYLGKHTLMGAITGPRYTFTVMKHQARHGLADVSCYWGVRDRLETLELLTGGGV
jgi:hypothetical protein